MTSTGEDDEDEDIRWTTLLGRDNDMSAVGTDCVFKIDYAPEDRRKRPFRFCRIFIEKTRNPGNFPVLHRVFIGGGEG